MSFTSCYFDHTARRKHQYCSARATAKFKLHYDATLLGVPFAGFMHENALSGVAGERTTGKIVVGASSDRFEDAGRERRKPETGWLVASDSKFGMHHDATLIVAPSTPGKVSPRKWYSRDKLGKDAASCMETHSPASQERERPAIGGAIPRFFRSLWGLPGESGKTRDWLAGGLGFEPRLAESESAVLPLDDPPPALGMWILRGGLARRNAWISGSF
jgi:hypothetical protein